MFLQATKNQAQKIWITLFDFIEDDEYDGDLTEDDEEQPKILLNFKVTSLGAQPSGLKKPTATRASWVTKDTRTVNQAKGEIKQHNYVPPQWTAYTSQTSQSSATKSG